MILYLIHKIIIEPRAMTSIDETQSDSADGYRPNIRDNSVDLGMTKHPRQKPPVTRKQWLLVLSAFVVFLNTWSVWQHEHLLSLSHYANDHLTYG